MLPIPTESSLIHSRTFQLHRKLFQTTLRPTVPQFWESSPSLSEPVACAGGRVTVWRERERVAVSTIMILTVRKPCPRFIHTPYSSLSVSESLQVQCIEKPSMPCGTLVEQQHALGQLNSMILCVALARPQVEEELSEWHSLSLQESV